MSDIIKKKLSNIDDEIDLKYYQAILMIHEISKNLRGKTTVEFSNNDFFFYWLKRCFEPSKI